MGMTGGRDVFGCEPVKGYIASITQHHMCRQLARTITRTREIKPGKHTQVLAQILTLSPLVEFSLALSWRIGKAIPIQLSFGSPFILIPFSPFIFVVFFMIGPGTRGSSAGLSRRARST